MNINYEGRDAILNKPVIISLYNNTGFSVQHNNQIKYYELPKGGYNFAEYYKIEFDYNTNSVKAIDIVNKTVILPYTNVEQLQLISVGYQYDREIDIQINDMYMSEFTTIELLKTAWEYFVFHTSEEKLDRITQKPYDSMDSSGGGSININDYLEIKIQDNGNQFWIQNYTNDTVYCSLYNGYNDEGTQIGSGISVGNNSNNYFDISSEGNGQNVFLKINGLYINGTSYDIWISYYWNNQDELDMISWGYQ